VFRPGVLRRFGWRVIDVPGRDWLRAPAAVLERIEQALRGEQEADDEAFELELASNDVSSTEPEADQVSAAPSVMPASTSASGPADEVRSLSFEQGTSRKFWRVARAGTELTISYGRIGTAGQVTIKTFETVERASRELKKLSEEKLRKGYVEGEDQVLS
jgi:predicted DNA-binding WGR domain protein